MQSPEEQPQRPCWSQVVLAYSFPVLDVGGFYHTEQDAINSITEAAYNAGCQGMETMYHVKAFSNPDCKPVLTMLCQHCEAFIKFVEVDGCYLLTDNANRHKHEAAILTEEQARYIELFGGEQLQLEAIQQELYIPASQLEQQVVDQQSLSLLGRYDRLRHDQKLLKGAPPLRTKPHESKTSQTYSAINLKPALQYLEQRKFHVVVRYGQDKTGGQPLVLVLASPEMRNLFATYGDWVGICVVPSGIEQVAGLTYQFVVAYGYDSNLQPIVLSLALAAQLNVKSYYTIIKSMEKIHRKPISCLVTDNNPVVQEAIDIMKEVGEFQGIHLLDLEVFDQEVEKRIAEADGKQVLRSISRQIIEQNRLEKAQSLFKELQEHQSSLSHYMQQVQSQICMSSFPCRFVGLYFSRRSQIIQWAQREFSTITTMQKVFDRIAMADFQIPLLPTQVVLDRESKGTQPSRGPAPPPGHFQEKIDELFEDIRLDAVKKELSSSLFVIFMQNYLKQFEPHNCLVIQEECKQGAQVEPNQPVFVVDLVLLRCSCQYTWKTGLPCWHMLSVAAKSPTTTYTSLIHKRWRAQTTTGAGNKT